MELNDDSHKIPVHEDDSVESADSFAVLRRNPASAQKVIHALLFGKHIDLYLAEEFRFLENFPAAWEEYFQWMGYRLRRSELGASPFYFLEPATDLAGQLRLSRGATFLGLYLAWHFFMQGPGEPDRIVAEEVFQRLVASYPFHFLRAVFVRKTGNLSPMELSEDQAEKLRGYMRRELGELSKYRFIDVRPNARVVWGDLIIHRLPALYRFWELALHVYARSRNGNGHGKENGDDDGNGAGSGTGPGADSSIGVVINEVWGSLEPESDEDEP